MITRMMRDVKRDSPPRVASLGVKDRLRRGLGFVCVALFAGLTLVVLWQVISRYLLAHPSSASEEIARILLMWLGLVGACYTHLDNQHIAIRLWPDLHPSQRDRLIILLCQVFSLFLLVGGARLCMLTFELHQTTPVLGLPMGLVYLVLPLSGLGLAVGNYFHYQEKS